MAYSVRGGWAGCTGLFGAMLLWVCAAPVAGKRADTAQPHNLDLSFTKEFMIKESKTLQLRGELFNFTNTEPFAFPDLAVGSARFADVTSSAPGFSPRVFQFGMRFQF